MSPLIIAFVASLGAGLATSIGASLVFFTRSYSPLYLAVGLSLSAGVMIYISLVEILFKSVSSYAVAFNSSQAYMAASLTFFGGVLFTYFLDFLVHLLFSFVGITTHDHILPDRIASTKTFTEKQPKNRLYQTALLTSLAIALHNFPEGLATFIGMMNNPKTGIPLVIAIAIHNIPEGICVAIPVYFATKSKVKAFLWGSMPGLTEPLGALFGWSIVGDGNPWMYGILFGMVAGMMIYISFKELLPTAHRYDPQDKVVSTTCFVGMALMSLSLVLFQILEGDGAAP